MMASLESLETRLLLEVKLRNNAYVTHIFNCLLKYSLISFLFFFHKWTSF